MLPSAKDAIKTRSEWIGEYPYPVVSVVQGPESFGGGMEYPTITIISPTSNEKILDFTIAHEIGHNWFYGILGSNERKYPWLDEGLNTYYDNRYSQWKYGDQGEINIASASVKLKDLERVLFETKAVAKNDQLINSTSENFTANNYGLTAYYKTGAWLEYVESVIGKQAFDKAIQEYYRRWQFKHPQPADFKKVMEESSNSNLDSMFALLNKKGILPNLQRTGTKAIFLFNTKAYADYITHPSKNVLVYGPSLGFNSYDKLMIGGLLTNYKLPASRLQFFLAPMYGTGSKKLAGTGLVNYTFYPSTIFQKINVGVSASTFSISRYTDSAGNKTFSSFHKLAPSLKFILKEKHPRSTSTHYIQFKSFFIGEQALRFYRDTTISPANDTTISYEKPNDQ